ncbi:MAG: MATE family efflux transporter [Clostridiales bacterium]|nr:MATE family efflux transporter [Clostridiales bacterium]
MGLKNKLIGDRAFYSMVLKISVPIMVQNGITNLITLVNNVTVGQLGTEQMSGVAIANQLITIFNMCIFGAVSGAGIFGAQLFGRKDQDGIRSVFRIKFILCIALTLLVMAVFGFMGTPLISAFLQGSSDGGNLNLALSEGYQYLLIMLIGFIPYAIGQVYSSTLREVKETVVPMRAGIAALVLSVGLNFLLIPILGVAGAAWATVVSRFVEMGLMARWTHTHVEEVPFIHGVYRSMKVPGGLAKQVIAKGTPLLINETLWSVGMTMINQTYSVHGLAVVAGINIATTLSNLISVIFKSVGVSVGIVVGSLLGTGDMDAARDADTKMIAFSVMISLGVAAMMAAISPLFPQLYNTTAQVKDLAMWFILGEAVRTPLRAFVDATYYTLRSGGKTIITSVFDSGFVWLGNFGSAYVLTYFTQIPIVPLYFLCQLVEALKCVIGYVLVKRGSWMNQIMTD